MSVFTKEQLSSPQGSFAQKILKKRKWEQKLTTRISHIFIYKVYIHVQYKYSVYIMVGLACMG